jgi:hypothetical protein
MSPDVGLRADRMEQIAGYLRSLWLLMIGFVALLSTASHDNRYPALPRRELTHAATPGSETSQA